MTFEEDEIVDGDQSDVRLCAEKVLKSDQPVQYLPSDKISEKEQLSQIQPVQEFTFLNMNAESLKEKQIDQVVDIQVPTIFYSIINLINKMPLLMSKFTIS